MATVLVKFHIQLENYPREKCYTSTSRLRKPDKQQLQESIWTQTWLSTSPLSRTLRWTWVFKVWPANPGPHCLYLRTWTMEPPHHPYILLVAPSCGDVLCPLINPYLMTQQIPTLLAESSRFLPYQQCSSWSGISMSQLFFPTTSLGTQFSAPHPTPSFFPLTCQVPNLGSSSVLFPISAAFFLYMFTWAGSLVTFASQLKCHLLRRVP